MKHILLLLFILLYYYVSISQRVYNNTVNKANKVEVKGGLVTILNADTVIVQIYVNKKAKTNLYLDSITSTADSFGFFTTTFFIRNPEDPEYYDVFIKFEFTQPIESIFWYTGLTYGMDDSIKVDDKLTPAIKFRKCECDEAIKVIVKSKAYPKCSIYGIVGATFDQK